MDSPISGSTEELRLDSRALMSTQAEEVQHAVVLIHGINSLGNWTQIVGDTLRSNTLRPVAAKYGRFPVPRFLAPWDASRAPIRAGPLRV